MEETRKYVHAAILARKVVVFSKTYCEYCRDALEILTKVGLRAGKDMNVIQIENLINCNEIQDCLMELTGARSVSYLAIAMPMGILSGRLL